MLDIESLLAPVSESQPVGENLEYAEVDQLARLAAGSRGTFDPTTQEEVGAVEPDWRQVRELAVALFARTKDLRVAVHLAFAMLRLEGWPGLAAGLALIEGLLDRYWDSVYPPLDKEADDDPIDRLNVLANLADPERAQPMLRTTLILESREVGRFTLRDLDLAHGRLSAKEGEQTPSIALLSAAWQQGVEQDNAARRAGVEDALRVLKAIGRLFQERSGQVLGLDALQSTLARLKDFYVSLTPEEGGGEAAVETTDTGAGVVRAASAGQSGPLANRADAVRLLRQVSEFLKRTEPSNPAPLFIDRAVKIAIMDFAGIVMELMPDAKDRIELLGGIKFED